MKQPNIHPDRLVYKAIELCRKILSAREYYVIEIVIIIMIIVIHVITITLPYDSNDRYRHTHTTALWQTFNRSLDVYTSVGTLVRKCTRHRLNGMKFFCEPLSRACKLLVLSLLLVVFILLRVFYTTEH